MALFDKKERLFLRLQKKSENIKNLINNLSSMSRQFLKTLSKMIICQSSFQGFKINIMVNLMISSRKLTIFGMLKIIKEYFTFNYLQKVQRKLNNKAQVLALNLEGLEINQGQSHQ